MPSRVVPSLSVRTYNTTSEAWGDAVKTELVRISGDDAEGRDVVLIEGFTPGRDPTSDLSSKSDTMTSMRGVRRRDDSTGNKITSSSLSPKSGTKSAWEDCFRLPSAERICENRERSARFDTAEDLSVVTEIKPTRRTRFSEVSPEMTITPDSPTTQPNVLDVCQENLTDEQRSRYTKKIQAASKSLIVSESEASDKSGGAYSMFGLGRSTIRATLGFFTGEAGDADDGGRRALFEFSDVNAIKANVRKRLQKKESYSVFQLYHSTGFFQRVAKHPVFEYFTLLVIATNAVWMAVDTDNNKAESLAQADIVYIVMENVFCGYFTIEWIVRFMALRKKIYGLRDNWFMFDTLLVFLMTTETWILSGFLFSAENNGPLGNTAVLRLFRLLRLSRLIRMFRSIGEVMILISGMLRALRSVFYVLVLLVAITYVFAIACTQMSGDTDYGADYFPNVGTAMYSLVIYGTFLDEVSSFCNDIKKESLTMLAVIAVYVGLSAMTVMNMLIGVLCEVVQAVAHTEKETMLTESVRSQLTEIMDALDVDDNRMISFKEFQRILEFPKALQALENVHVDPVGLVDFAESFFEKDGMPTEMPFERFMELVLDLRETNQVTVKDIMSLWKQINSKFAIQEMELTAVKHKTQEISRDLKRSIGRIEDDIQAVLVEVQKLAHRGSVLSKDAIEETV